MRERLLVGHFLRRFVENDLISPEAGRHQVLTVTASALLTSTLFITIFLTLKYIFDPFQTPGRTSIIVLDDRLFYLICSMTLMSLVAVAVWDALSLDARDASIIGMLPISRGLLVRAKLTAVAILAVGFAVALNVVPSVLHPSLVAAKLPLGVTGALRLMTAHAAANLAAGAFGFLAVLALRELAHAVLGESWFRRVSASLQAILVLSLVTAFLLAPVVSSGVARLRLAQGDTVPALPPLWFLGVQEAIAGDAIVALPLAELPPGFARIEQGAVDQYESHRRNFLTLSGIGVTALAVTAVLAIGLYAWNNRRLPVPIARSGGKGYFSALPRVSARLLGVRHPVARAGYFFALRVFWRSAPHRVTMMAAAAVGLAGMMVVAGGSELRSGGVDAAAPLELLSVQTILLLAVLAGFHHVLRVPAELRANWSVQMAWPGDERRYLSGVKRAGLVAVGLPTLVVLLPLHAFALPASLAVAHFLYGFLLVLIGNEIVSFGLRNPPFAVAYTPKGNMKALVPLLGAAALALTYGIAQLERLALGDLRSAMWLFGFLLVMLASLRLLDRRHRAANADIEWEVPSSSAPQGFDLNG